MRLWTLHPMYLDTAGLTAAWREGLLAQKVTAGLTKGYTNHPQLVRFRSTDDPQLYMGLFLYSIYEEAVRRGYSFDHSKIGILRNFADEESQDDLLHLSEEFTALRLPVTEGQVCYEQALLFDKLYHRCPLKAPPLSPENTVEVHPLFKVVPGVIETWEKVIPEIAKKARQVSLHDGL